MIFNKSDYDGKKLKGYKSFEDYRLFYDGYVESLEYNHIADNSAVCVLREKVKPTQGDNTYLTKHFMFVVCTGQRRWFCCHLSLGMY